MKRFNKVFALMILLSSALAVNAQIKFDSIGLGQSYWEAMSFIEKEHTYKVEEIDTLTFHMVEFYDSTQKMLVALYFDQENMVLSHIHMEEPHHLRGRREHRLMVANMLIWADQLHPHEILECYVDGDTYIEEVLDAESDGVHTVKVQFPMRERRMIVDVYMELTDGGIPSSHLHE